MADDLDLEKLLVRLLHHVGKALPNRSIVKGGMVLRLLDCPRRTNDLDVLLIPFGSKKDASPLLEEALRTFPCDGIELKAHSTAIRAKIRQGALIAQVEASVAEDCPSTFMSTANLARLHGLHPQVVQVMRFDVALANKLGAWMDRALLRDLYDIGYWVGIQKVRPDPATLASRLGNVRSRNRKGGATAWTVGDLADSLDARLGTLTDDQLRDELLAVLPDEEFAGLAARLRGSLGRFTAELRFG